MPAPDDVIISPARTPKDPVLPPVGLLFVNPSEAKRAAVLAKKYRMVEYSLFNSRLFASANDDTPFFMAGPAVGAPMAVLCLEKLIACGAGTIIVMGWCGALQPSLSPGDLVLPTLARSAEGTSAHYPINCSAASDAGLLQQLASSLKPHVPEPCLGPIWTTDAPYRETRGTIQNLQAEGLLAVDMEFSALCTVAAFRGIRLAAVMLVSDLLYVRDWRPAFHTKSFKHCSRQLVERLIDFCRNSPLDHPGK